MASSKHPSLPLPHRAATLPQIWLLVIGNILALTASLLYGFMTLWSMLFLDAPQVVQNLWMPLVTGVGSLMTVPASWMLLHRRRPATAVMVSVAPAMLVAIGILAMAILDSML